MFLMMLTSIYFIFLFDDHGGLWKLDDDDDDDDDERDERDDPSWQSMSTRLNPSLWMHSNSNCHPCSLVETPIFVQNIFGMANTMSRSHFCRNPKSRSKRNPLEL